VIRASPISKTQHPADESEYSSKNKMVDNGSNFTKKAEPSDLYIPRSKRSELDNQHGVARHNTLLNDASY
jgi:hypothetical protein